MRWNPGRYPGAAGSVARESHCASRDGQASPPVGVGVHHGGSAEPSSFHPLQRPRTGGNAKSSPDPNYSSRIKRRQKHRVDKDAAELASRAMDDSLARRYGAAVAFAAHKLLRRLKNPAQIAAQQLRFRLVRDPIRSNQSLGSLLHKRTIRTENRFPSGTGIRRRLHAKASNPARAG